MRPQGGRALEGLAGRVVVMCSRFCMRFRGTRYGGLVIIALRISLLRSWDLEQPPLEAYAKRNFFNSFAREEGNIWG